MPYVPLTEAQFTKAQSAGFSTQQIIGNEKVRKAAYNPFNPNNPQVKQNTANTLKGSTQNLFQNVGNEINEKGSIFGKNVGQDYMDMTKNLGSDISQNADFLQSTEAGGANNAKGSFPKAIKNVAEEGVNLAHIGTDALAGVFSPITEILKPVIKGDANALANNKHFQNFSQTPGATDIVTAASQATQKYQDWASKNPEKAKAVETGINVLAAYEGPEAEAAVTGAVKNTSGEVLDATIPTIQKTADAVGALPDKAAEAVDAGKTALQKRAIGQVQSKLEEVFTGTKSAKKAYVKGLDTGRDAAAFGANNPDFLPDTPKGKIDAQSAIGKIDTQYVQPRAQLLDAALKAKDKTISPNDYVSVDDLGKQSKANILKDPLAKGKGDLSDREAAIDKLTAEFKKQYGDKVSYSQLNEIKKGQWAKSKSFTITKPDTSGFMADTHYQIGSAAKDAIQNGVGEAPIQQLNSEIGDAMNYSNQLRKLDGGAVKGGRLGGYFARTVGGIAGATHGPVGVLSGGAIANFVHGVILDNTIAGPIKRAILSGVQSDSPVFEQAQEALKTLQETPAYPEVGQTTKSTVAASDLGKAPEAGSQPPVKVRNYQTPSSTKYITKDQISKFSDLLKAKDQAGKNIDMGLQPGSSVFRANPNSAPPDVISNLGKNMDISKVPIKVPVNSADEMAAMNADNLATAGEDGYSHWTDTAQQGYSKFKKIFNAWKDNPEDYAQLSKTAAGKQLQRQIYDVAKEMGVTENEVYDQFESRILSESKKGSSLFGK